MKIFVLTANECKLVTIHDSCISEFQQHNADQGVSWVVEPRAADIIVLFEEWDMRFWQQDFGVFYGKWDRIFTINCDELGRDFCLAVTLL
jgi:hypothetical protein